MTEGPYISLIHSNLDEFGEVGRRYPLHKSEVYIGSGRDMDIQLPSSLVSPKHFHLYRKDEGWAIQDLTPSQSLYVNGILTKYHHLQRDGELFRIGEITFKFFLGYGIESSYDHELYQRTIIDPLTQAFNRRYLIERLHSEMARISRRHEPLSIVMFDLDHFRNVNNTHGHLAGDYVLKELVRRIKKRTRKQEPLARYGGEEFAIILPNSTNIEAYQFAEQIRKLIQEEPFVYKDLMLSMTISGGVATTEYEFSWEDFIKQADERLYRAKEEGRNRIIAEDTP